MASFQRLQRPSARFGEVMAFPRLHDGDVPGGFKRYGYSLAVAVGSADYDGGKAVRGDTVGDGHWLSFDSS